MMECPKSYDRCKRAEELEAFIAIISLFPEDWT